MRLNQLQFLVELKKHGTISKTAQQLFISQPSLSAAIKELEEELGFEIIKRTHKGVIFTSRGEMVLEYSQNVVQEVNKIKRLGQLRDHVLQGHLSVGCVAYICHTVILDTILELKNRYPKMLTSLREESSYDLMEQVSSKEIQLGIIMMSNLEEAFFMQMFQNYNLQFQKLFDDEMYFWVGRNHPFYGRDTVTMEEMLQFPFVTYRNLLNQFNRNMLLRYNRELEFIQIDDRESLKRYLTKSQAVSVMPMCTFWQDRYYQEQQLKPLRIENFVWTTKIGWIYGKEELFSAEQLEFVNTLLESVNHLIQKQKLNTK